MKKETRYSVSGSKFTNSIVLCVVSTLPLIIILLLVSSFATVYVISAFSGSPSNFVSITAVFSVTTLIDGMRVKIGIVAIAYTVAAVTRDNTSAFITAEGALIFLITKGPDSGQNSFSPSWNSI